VLLRPAQSVGDARGAPISPEAAETVVRATTALDGNAALAPVGDTAFGRLWRHDADADIAGAGAIPANAGGLFGLLAAIVAAVIIGATVLLSIPTGAGREAVRQAHRDAIRQTVRANAKQKRFTRAKRTSASRTSASRRGPARRSAAGASVSTPADTTPIPEEVDRVQ
jgi:hypothetical protein